MFTELIPSPFRNPQVHLLFPMGLEERSFPGPNFEILEHTPRPGGTWKYLQALAQGARVAGATFLNIAHNFWHFFKIP